MTDIVESIQKASASTGNIQAGNELPTSKEAKAGGVLPQESEIQYPSGLALFLVVIALLLSMFFVALDMSIIATAIPSITAEFHSLDDVGWYGSALFMCLSVFVSAWGRGYKYFSLKRVFLLSIVVFELGSLICAVAQNSTTIIVGRAVQGAGGAGVSNGAFTIVAFTVRPSKVPALMGLFGTVFALASVAGPLLGGVLTQNVTWRWCFYINLPFGGAAILILVFLYHDPQHFKAAKITRKEFLLLFDVPGMVSLLGASLCFYLAIGWGGVTKPWNSPNVIGALVGWISLSIVFVVIQWLQGERALLPPRLLKLRTIAVCSAFYFCITSGGFARNYNLPIYFQAVDGVSPSESGIRTLATVLCISIFTLLSSGLLGRVGYYQPFLIVGSAINVVGSGLIYTLGIGSPASEYITYQVISGIGSGIAVQVPVIVAQATSTKADISSAVATVLFFQFVSGGMGIGMGQSIFTNRLLDSLPTYAPGVSPAQVLAVGAVGIADAFPPSQVEGILQSYMVGLRSSWLMTLGLTSAAFVVSLAAGWTSIKPNKKPAPIAVETAV